MRTNAPNASVRRQAGLRAWKSLMLGGVLFLLAGNGCRQDPARNNAAPPGALDERGEAPTRIISLAPSITEILFALGLGDRVVGVTSYCDYPPATAALPKIGGLLDPNVEVILGLKPDVVILLRTHENAQAQLTALGITTLLVEGATVEQILDSITNIAAACGRADRGQALSRGLRERLERISKTVGDRPRPSVLISIGRTLGEGTLKDIYVAGDDGYFSELIRLAGGRNACGEQTIRFPLVTQEGILQMKPDVIIELAADLERGSCTTADILREWQALKHVPAVDRGRVYIFTDDFVTVPGPRFVDLLDMMAAAIHPDAATAAGDALERAP